MSWRDHLEWYARARRGAQPGREPGVWRQGVCPVARRLAARGERYGRPLRQERIVEAELPRAAAEHPVEEALRISTEHVGIALHQIGPRRVHLVQQPRRPGRRVGARRLEHEAEERAVAGRERISEAPPRGAQSAIADACRVGNADAVVEAAVDVGPALRFADPGCEHAIAVVEVEMARVAEVGEREAVLVLGDRAGAVGVEAREVEEAQRPAVHGEIAAGTSHHAAPVQVPVGDVVSRVAQHLHAREQAWHEVDPLLVDEETARDVDHALLFDATVPPVEKAAGLVRSRDADEPEVVGAGLQDLQLAGMAVVLDRLIEVRRQHHVALGERRADLNQRRGHQDVGVEVEEPLRAEVEQPAQERRLDRGVELEDRVAEREGREVVDAEVLRLDQLEGLRLRVEPTFDEIDQGDEEAALGVVLAKATREDPGERQVVLRDDGARPQLPHHASSNACS